MLPVRGHLWERAGSRLGLSLQDTAQVREAHRGKTWASLRGSRLRFGVPWAGRKVFDDVPWAGGEDFDGVPWTGRYDFDGVSWSGR
eukprot:791291-Rhodomonas_salina.3